MLVHDGRVITELTVICEYVDDQWPDHPLKPRDSFGRAQIRLWTKQLDEGLHPAVDTLSFCVAFRHQWLARRQEWVFETKWDSFRQEHHVSYGDVNAVVRSQPYSMAALLGDKARDARRGTVRRRFKRSMARAL